MPNARSQQAHKLAETARLLARTALKDKREREGFSAFIFDLKQCNVQETGWSCTNGLLRVILPATEETVVQLNAFLDQQLAGKPWYTPSTAIEAAQIKLTDADHVHPDGFKVLGRFGENPAVDPTLFLANEHEPIRVLSIKRMDGTRALPGGMAPEAVTQKCIDELLEECFSGKFFAEGSVTSQIIDSSSSDVLLADNAAELKKSFVAILNTCELNQMQKMALITTLNSLQPAATASAFINRSLTEMIPETFTECERLQTIAHIRVGLYKQLCYDNYNRVLETLKPRMQQGPIVTNYSDPRNTQAGYMITRTIGMVVNDDVLTQLAQQGLEKDAAADDASHAHFPTLEEFCSDVQNPAYSDHAGLVLDALAAQIEVGIITDTPLLESQLNQIETNFNAQSQQNFKRKFSELSQNQASAENHLHQAIGNR